METSHNELPGQQVEEPVFPPPPATLPVVSAPGSSGADNILLNQDALAVRQNLARRVLLSLRDLGSVRRRNLIFISVFSLAQITAFIVILALTSRSSCDKPLRTCLILTIVRLSLSLPLNAYASLTPTARRMSEDRRRELEAERRFGSATLDRRVRQLSDVALALSICVFLLLNIYVFSSRTCHATSPPLFYTTVVALVFSYLFAAEIILLLLAIIFFLPLALIGIRWFGWGEKSPEIGPLKTADIEKLPLRIFIGLAEQAVAAAASEETPAATPSSSTPTPSPPTPTPPPPRRLFRFWKYRKPRVAPQAPTTAAAATSSETRALPPGVEGIRLNESQTSCAICLNDYEPPPPADEPWEPETLRLLPCGHVFHHPCVDSWLVTSGRCPICQAPVLPKKGKGTDSAV